MDNVHPEHLKPIKEKAMVFINMFRDRGGVSLEKSKACSIILAEELKKQYSKIAERDLDDPESMRKFQAGMDSFDYLIKCIQSY